ncbi:MAG: hypothetical protein ACOC7U_09795 [Spirochaetota bacterium]
MIAHDVLTYVCALSAGLDSTPVAITPYTYSGYDHDLYNPYYRLEMREGKKPTVSSSDSHIDENEYYGEFINYHIPENGRVPSLEVLAMYSAEPDWGMDDGIWLSPLQVLTKGSQGYRHLRFGLFGFRVGVAHKRLFHFTRLAEAGFKKNDLYWGLRFSARALHFLEDLLTPVHTKPFPELYPFLKIFSLRDLYFETYNYHLNFERMVSYYLWHGHDHFIRVIENAPGIPFTRKNLVSACWRVRLLFYPIFAECRRMWGGRMGRGFVKVPSEEIAGRNMSSSMEGYIKKWLKIASGMVKGYLKKVVAPNL